MRSATKITSIVAAVGAGALGVGLIGFGTGVGADFTSAVTGQANINVGTLGCLLSTTNPGAVTISQDEKSATVTLPMITSSEPNSQDASLTVTNTGNIPLTVIPSVSTSGTLTALSPDPVHPIALTSSGTLKSSDHVTYQIGFYWGELENSAFGRGETATYTFTCTDAGASAPKHLTFMGHDGGTATWNGTGIALNIPSNSAPSVGAYVGLPVSNGSSLPVQAPVFTTDQYNGGAPRWDIHLSNGTSTAQLVGYPSAANNGQALKWQLSGSALTGGSSLDWSTVKTDANGYNVTKAGIIADFAPITGATYTISCMTYDGNQYVGTGTCS